MCIELPRQRKNVPPPTYRHQSKDILAYHLDETSHPPFEYERQLLHRNQRSIVPQEFGWVRTASAKPSQLGSPAHQPMSANRRRCQVIEAWWNRKDDQISGGLIWTMDCVFRYRHSPALCTEWHVARPGYCGEQLELITIATNDNHKLTSLTTTTRHQNPVTHLKVRTEKQSGVEKKA